MDGRRTAYRSSSGRIRIRNTFSRTGTHGVPLVDPPSDEPNDTHRPKRQRTAAAYRAARTFVVDQHVADLFPPPSHAERRGIESPSLQRPDLQRTGKLRLFRRAARRSEADAARRYRRRPHARTKACPRRRECAPSGESPDSRNFSSSGIGVTMILPRLRYRLRCLWKRSACPSRAPRRTRAPELSITSPLNPMPLSIKLEDDEMQRQQRIDQTHFDHRPVALGADSMLANQFDPPVDEALGRSRPSSTFEVIVSVN